MEYLTSKKIKLSITAIIGIYFAVILLFAVNFPISDDFAILDFLNKFSGSDNIKEKARLLFAQHNEHRIVTTKLTFLIYHKLFGTINFVHLSIIGNLAIIGIYLLFIRQMNAGTDAKKIVALIIACLLFQCGSAESMIWAMASISNYYVLFFAIFTMACLRKEKRTFALLSILSAALATYTQGNGIIILILGNFYLLIRKRYQLLTIWICVTIVVISTYFSGYQTPDQHSDPFQFYLYLGKIIMFMLAFIGSAFGIGGSHYPVLTKICLVPTVAIGLWVCLTTLFLFCKKQYKDGNIFLWINLFVILTSFLTAVSRINFNISQALASRYHVNSAVIIASTILLSYQHIDSQTSIKAATLQYYLKLLPIFFILYTIFTFPMVYYFSYKVYHPIKSGDIIFPIKEKAIDILKQSRLNGIYTPAVAYN